MFINLILIMTQEAYLLLSVEAGREKELLEELKKYPVVDEAFILFGPYDLLVKVKCDDKDGLKLCINQVSSLDGIGKIETLEVADVVV